jgi:hypothetical protein
MKKISLVLSAMVLFAGVSFANPVAKKGAKQDKAKTEKTEKKTTKKGGKKGSKSTKKEAAAK